MPDVNNSAFDLYMITGAAGAVNFVILPAGMTPPEGAQPLLQGADAYAVIAEMQALATTHPDAQAWILGIAPADWDQQMSDAPFRLHFMTPGQAPSDLSHRFQAMGDDDSDDNGGRNAGNRGSSSEDGEDDDDTRNHDGTPTREFRLTSSGETPEGPAPDDNLAARILFQRCGTGTASERVTNRNEGEWQWTNEPATIAGIPVILSIKPALLTAPMLLAIGGPIGGAIYNLSYNETLFGDLDASYWSEHGLPSGMAALYAAYTAALLHEKAGGNAAELHIDTEALWRSTGLDVDRDTSILSLGDLETSWFDSDGHFHTYRETDRTVVTETTQVTETMSRAGVIDVVDGNNDGRITGNLRDLVIEGIITQSKVTEITDTTTAANWEKFESWSSEQGTLADINHQAPGNDYMATLLIEGSGRFHAGSSLDGRVTDLDAIELGDGSQIMIITADDVLDIGENGILRIYGDGSDTVRIGAGWNDDGVAMVDGMALRQYSMNVSGNEARLLVDTDIAVVA